MCPDRPVIYSPVIVRTERFQLLNVHFVFFPESLCVFKFVDLVDYTPAMVMGNLMNESKISVGTSSIARVLSLTAYVILLSGMVPMDLG